jgi:hypothetical protein
VAGYHDPGAADRPHLVVAALTGKHEIVAALCGERSKLLDEVTLPNI